jgi:hypothetical protein
MFLDGENAFAQTDFFLQREAESAAIKFYGLIVLQWKKSRLKKNPFQLFQRTFFSYTDVGTNSMKLWKHFFEELYFAITKRNLIKVWSALFSAPKDYLTFMSN